jgi:hypothetical protein
MYLPWVAQPQQLLGCSLRVQVFCRVKRGNARRCVVDKLVTFNPNFTVETCEFPNSMKGQRDGAGSPSLRGQGAGGRQRPHSAML